MMHFTRAKQDPISRLARAISEDLCQALIYYQMFAPTARDTPLILRVNVHEIHEGFNVISEALDGASLFPPDQAPDISAISHLWA
jgi:hypothetical protein